MSGWHLATVGVDVYEMQPNWHLPQASESQAILSRLLTKHQAGIANWTQYANNTQKDFLLEKLASHANSSIIFYWAGHGEHNENSYLAALSDSSFPLNSRNALTAVQLFEALRDHLRLRTVTGAVGDWTLLVLDTCGSGAGVSILWSDLLREFKSDLANVGLIATTGDGGATAGRFPRDLERVLAGFGPNDTAGIKVKELLRRLEDLWESTAGPVVEHRFLPTAVIPLPADQDQPVQAPVETYEELRRVLNNTSPKLRNHFYAKAQGAEIGEPAWHFTGREAERRVITTWLHNTTSGMLVITGLAGSGKSALLGMTLASSDPAVRAALLAAGQDPIPRDLRPEDQEFQAVVHLSGRTLLDTVSILAGDFNLEARCDSADMLIELLKVRAVARSTILADALDEARDPFPIAVLLRRLADIDGIRLLVGTRQSMGESPDHAAPPDQMLLDALVPHQVLKLEDDPTAVYRYTKDRLGAKLPFLQPEQVNSLSLKISALKQPFLFARLAVHEIAAKPTWAMPDADLEQLLSSGHTGIFERTIARLRHDNPRVEVLLHALAYARGNGFPRNDSIWVTAASAMTGHPLGDVEVEEALAIASPYILQDTEAGQTVYRLAHRTFVEWYRRQDALVVPSIGNLPGFDAGNGRGGITP